MISTDLTRRLGIEHPIILAPMGFVSGSALAAMVSAAGGF
jgi:nitronate monooxygenase